MIKTKKSVLFFIFFIIFILNGCKYLEHSPYYLSVEHCGDTGIKKIDMVLPENNAKIYHIVQKASEKWKDSGIHLKINSIVQIRAKGYWGCCVEHLGYHTPDGYGLDTADRFPWCALLGKIGKKGEPFLVGSLCTFKTYREGNLYFIMNDGVNCYSNNSGEVKITVAILNPKNMDNLLEQLKLKQKEIQKKIEELNKIKNDNKKEKK